MTKQTQTGLPVTMNNLLSKYEKRKMYNGSKLKLCNFKTLLKSGMDIGHVNKHSISALIQQLQWGKKCHQL